MRGIHIIGSDLGSYASSLHVLIARRAGNGVPESGFYVELPAVAYEGLFHGTIGIYFINLGSRLYLQLGKAGFGNQDGIPQFNSGRPKSAIGQVVSIDRNQPVRGLFQILSILPLCRGADVQPVLAANAQFIQFFKNGATAASIGKYIDQGKRISPRGITVRPSSQLLVGPDGTSRPVFPAKIILVAICRALVAGIRQVRVGRHDEDAA